MRHVYAFILQLFLVSILAKATLTPMDQSKFCVVPVVDCFSVQYRWKILLKEKRTESVTEITHNT